jgi:hypothetical protein
LEKKPKKTQPTLTEAMSGTLRSDIISLLASGASVTDDIAQLRRALAGESAPQSRMAGRHLTGDFC